MKLRHAAVVAAVWCGLQMTAMQTAAQSDLTELDESMYFAPMWVPAPKEQQSCRPREGLATAAYSQLWLPDCQKAIGFSDSQQEQLGAINAKYVAEIKRRTEEARKAAAGASSPKTSNKDSAAAIRKLYADAQSETEAILTPKQRQLYKDFVFPGYAIGFLHKAAVRRQIGMTTEQEAKLQQVFLEHMSRFQEVQLDQAVLICKTLTKAQQKELPELVKRQGPTSAVLSLCWEMGFYSGLHCQSHPMLAMSPVRERLGLSNEQKQKLQTLMESQAAENLKKTKLHRQAAQARLDGKKNLPKEREQDASIDDREKINAILTPKQMATLEQMEFRRKVVLALGYPKKRESIGITKQQVAEFERLERQAASKLQSIEHEMKQKPVDILTPAQKTELRKLIDQRR